MGGGWRCVRDSADGNNNILTAFALSVIIVGGCSVAFSPQEVLSHLTVAFGGVGE